MPTQEAHRVLLHGSFPQHFFLLLLRLVHYQAAIDLTLSMPQVKEATDGFAGNQSLC
jgi:hypothetical protein